MYPSMVARIYPTQYTTTKRLAQEDSNQSGETLYLVFCNCPYDEGEGPIHYGTFKAIQILWPSGTIFERVSPKARMVDIGPEPDPFQGPSGMFGAP